MYKCIHATSGEEIVILHPRWAHALAELRALDRADLLVCQGCRQPVRVKAGTMKRAHFAHKHLKACAYGTASPEILMARAVLYHWLIRRFDPAQVTLEHPLPGLPRPVDGWVTTPDGALAYWIIDAGLRLESRKTIQQTLQAGGIRPTWVLLSKLLYEETPLDRLPGAPSPSTGQAPVAHDGSIKPDQLASLRAARARLIPGRSSLLLSPTERACVQATPYDEPLAGAHEEDAIWGTLHYLDPEHERLFTFRAISLVHRPNWFQGMRMQSDLDKVEVDASTGGFVYPGEAYRLADLRKRQRQLADKRQRYEERLAHHTATARPEPPPPRRDRWESPPPERTPEPLPCVTCGQVTTDYWSTFYRGDEKVCRCRACLSK